MLSAIGRRTLAWVDAATPWSNVVGVARSLLALSTALTLTLSSPNALFRPAVGIDQVPVCEVVHGAGLFCVATRHGMSLDLTRVLAILALLVVASGWRPRLTGVLHWWIAWSFDANALTLDGGDQVAAVLTLILLPITLTDPRAWHWSAPPERRPGLAHDTLRIIALVALTCARVQVAGIYFHAAVAKFAVTEWADGTVLWYWLLDPSLGAPGWLTPVLRPLLASAAVAPLTWSVLALESLLASALILPKSRWAPLLAGGIALHAGIIVLHGLVSFALAMFAALVLYLRPTERVFTFRWPSLRVGRLAVFPRGQRGRREERDLPATA
jgi:antimicrobial peptide system SdpB family protein